MTTILLADDHHVFRECLRELLDRESDLHVVGEAESGREAVELARSTQPNVVLMDISMPELNGIDATVQIRAASPESRVIALSTHSDRQFVDGMMKAGARGYLLKHARFEDVVHAVRIVASGQSYLHPQVAHTLIDGYVDSLAGGAASTASDPQLSTREREVLQLIAEGKSTKETANSLGLSVSTIESHRRQIMKRLNLHSVAELTKYAVRHGLTSLE